MRGRRTRASDSRGSAANLNDEFVCTVIPSEDPDAEDRLIEALKWLLSNRDGEEAAVEPLAT